MAKTDKMNNSALVNKTNIALFVEHMGKMKKIVLDTYSEVNEICGDCRFCTNDSICVITGESVDVDSGSCAVFTGVR